MILYTFSKQNSLEDVNPIITVKALSTAPIFLAGIAHGGMDIIYNTLYTGPASITYLVSSNAITDHASERKKVVEMISKASTCTVHKCIQHTQTTYVHTYAHT